MLQVEYHPRLVEQAVFLAARRDRTIETALRTELDAVYEIADLHLREARFGQVHEQWFVRMGLFETVRDLIRERPLIESHVQRCHIREAASRKRQNVELFVRRATNDHPEDSRALFIDLCPDFLLDTERLRPWLQRELFKVSDMLDAAFGYSPDLPETHRARQNLIRDRYGVLWDIYVETRLQPAMGPSDLHARIRERFNQAFSRGGAGAPTQCLKALLELPATTHSSLLGWALAPETMPGWQPDPNNAWRAPGELCPLCGFPTYDWYTASHDRPDDIHDIISSVCPTWRPEQGVCRQCAEACAAIGRADPAG